MQTTSLIAVEDDTQSIQPMWSSGIHSGLRSASHWGRNHYLAGITSAIRNIGKRSSAMLLVALLSAFDAGVAFAVGPNAIPVELQESKSTVAGDTGFWENNDPGGHQTDLLWFQSEGENSPKGWNIYDECGWLGIALWHPQQVVRMPNKNGRAYFMVSQSDEGGGFISVLETKAGSLDPVTDLILPNNTPDLNGDVTGQTQTAGPGSAGVGNFIWAMGFPSNGGNPIGEWNHPAQMQVVGDVLAVVAQNFDSDCPGSDGLGSSPDSILFFDIRDPAVPSYLGLMSAPELGVQHIDAMALGRTPDGDYVLMTGGKHTFVEDIFPVPPFILIHNLSLFTHRVSTHLSTDVADWLEIPGGDYAGEFGPLLGLPKYRATLSSQHGSLIHSYQRVNSTAGEFEKGEERLVSFDTQYATGDYSTTPPKFSNSPLSPTFHELSQTKGWMPAHDGTRQYQLSDGFYYDYRNIPYAYSSGLPTDGIGEDTTLNGDDNGEWVWAKDSCYVTTYGMPVIYTVVGDHGDGTWGSWVYQLASHPPETYRPGNDSFSNAVALTSSDSVRGDTATAWPTEQATREAGEPVHAGGQSGSLWWSFTPLSAGTLTLDTFGSSFDTTLAVYTGADVSSLTLVASDNGGPLDTVEFPAASNVTYYIAVDGVGANSYGEVRLNHITTSGTIRLGALDPTTNSTINVSWIPEGFAANTEFSARRLSPFHTTALSVWGTNTSWTSEGLLPNIPYFYDVSARTDTGTNLITTVPVDLGSAFSLAAPPAPGTLTLVGERVIDVTWSANGNPTVNNRGGTQYFVENQTSGTDSGWTTNTFWQSTGLTRGTTNTFRVKARNGNYAETDWVDLGALSTADNVPLWYVSTTGSDAADGQSWATAKETIQAAIDEADPGNTVMVSNGVYQTGGRVAAGQTLTNRVVIDKAIAVQSVNGPGVTTIQGAWDPATTNGAAAIRCVYMAEGSMLTGFTVTNGATLSGGEGGGIYAGSASAVANNCVLSGNSAGVYGGGAYQATLNSCTLSGNSAGAYGGGAFGSTLNGCVLQGNSAAVGGGASAKWWGNPDDSALNNCTLSGNSALDGGGAAYITLNNCTLSGNNANYGGGARSSTLNNCLLTGNQSSINGGGSVLSTLNNCTLTGNHASNFGGGSWGDTEVNNCIVYSNTVDGSFYNNFDELWGSNINYSCTTPLPLGGTDNITAEPLFVSTNDFHLLAGSPCIDEGNNTNAPGTTDLEGTDRIVNGTVDMGAYEFVSATQVWYVATTGNDAATGQSWATAKQTIQAGIDKALVGNTVMVSNGLYATGGQVAGGGLLTNRVVISKAITVQSLRGAIDTIIQGAWDPATTNGNAAVRCVWIDDGATLTGFTLTNGATRTSGNFDQSGGGVKAQSDLAVLNNCILSGNSGNFNAGGSYYGTLNNCTLSGNSSPIGGGSFFGTLNNCLLTGNSALYDGGGSAYGTLNNCTLSGNSASISGGGSFFGTLNNCIVYANTATSSSNWNGSTFTYSCTYPEAAGTGNITNAPQFISANDYHLQLGSPCIDTGNNASAQGSTDLDGNPRIAEGIVDMGAYEFPPTIVTVSAVGGTTTGSGNFFPGSDIIISALGDNVHWLFTSWNDGDTNQMRTITVPLTNITYTATFTENTAAITSYVAIASTNPVWPYDTWATAATNIQHAADVAVGGYGDIVMVSNGVYQTGGRVVSGQSLTNRVVIDKTITVQSLNGPTDTIIQGAWDPATTNGDAAVRCVWIADGATLVGFTLTNGATRATGADDSQGGGVWGQSRLAVVSNCVLLDNSADAAGGGAYRGTLNNCTLSENSAATGGGTFDSALNNCTLSGNSASFRGGGVADSSLNNCTLTGNSASGSPGLPGDQYQAGGASVSTLNNCIAYGNSAETNAINNYGDYCTLNNSCTLPMPLGGAGNITNAPLFVSANNLHLHPGSPCINAGNNAYVMGTTDLDGNPRISEGTVDMGAYESLYSTVTVTGNGGTGAGSGSYYAGTDIVISALGDSSHWLFTSWNDGDTNQTRAITVPLTNITYTATFTEDPSAITVYVAIAGTSPVWPYTSWATAATNIQDAVDAALSGDSVIVSNGVYQTGGRVASGQTLTNRVVIDKAITVQSLHGPIGTIIQGAWDPVSTNGDAAVRCVWIGNGATLIDFTLTNGATRTSLDTVGGGVWAESDLAVVSNCVLSGNSAHFGGGGTYRGTLDDCTLSGNISLVSGVGGGAREAELNNCTLTGNSAVWGGGSYGGTLNNCTLWGNSAGSGGGSYLGTLNNCMLSGNSVESGGGGAYAGTLNNCTLTDNVAAGVGGGVRAAELNNCIVYWNTAPNSTNWYDSTFSFSCTTPMPSSGTANGNTTHNPLFVSLVSSNFNLAYGSPCRDSGSNASVPPGLDLAGNPRIRHGYVDMGAYEYQLGSSQADYDGDGMGNGDEGVAGTDVSDSNSVWKIYDVEFVNPTIKMTFDTITNREYSIDRKDILSADPWTELTNGIQGTGGPITIMDPEGVTNRVYRGRVKRGEP